MWARYFYVAILVVVGVCFGNVEASWRTHKFEKINAYFKGQKYGPNPGPCNSTVPDAIPTAGVCNGQVQSYPYLPYEVCSLPISLKVKILLSYITFTDQNTAKCYVRPGCSEVGTTPRHGDVYWVNKNLVGTYCNESTNYFVKCGPNANPGKLPPWDQNSVPIDYDSSCDDAGYPVGFLRPANPSAEVGDGWLQEGNGRLWNTEMNNLSITSLALYSNQPDKIVTDLTVGFNIQRIYVNLKTSFYLWSVEVLLPAFKFLGISYAARNLNLQAYSERPTTATISRASMKSGLSMQLSTRFFWDESNSKNSGNDIPYRMVFGTDGKGSPTCLPVLEEIRDAIKFNPDLGYKASMKFLFFTLTLPQSFLAYVIVSVLKTTLNGLLCELIDGLAVLPDSTPGIINVLMRDLYTWVHNYTDAPEIKIPWNSLADFMPYLLNFEEEVLVNSPSIVKENSMVFFEDPQFSLINDLVNNLLGSMSKVPEYQGKRVVVWLVDQILGNTEGKIDIYDAIIGTGLFTAEDFTFLVDMSAVNINLTLAGLEVEGINSFGDNPFSVIYPIFDGDSCTTDSCKGKKLNHTLSTVFGLDNLTLAIDFDLTLRPGIWVTNTAGLSQNSKRMTFPWRLQFDLGAVAVNMTNVALVNITETLSKKIGVFLDFPAGGLLDAALCGLNVLKNTDGLISALRFSFDSLVNLQMLNRQPKKPGEPTDGLVLAVNDFMNIFLNGTSGLFGPGLAGFTDILLRPMANDEIKEYLDEKRNISGDVRMAYCPSYVGNSTPELLDMSDPTSYAARAFDAFNDFVGGISPQPDSTCISADGTTTCVQDSDFDINSLVFIGLTTLSDQLLNDDLYTGPIFTPCNSDTCEQSNDVIWVVLEQDLQQPYKFIVEANVTDLDPSAYPDLYVTSIQVSHLDSFNTAQLIPVDDSKFLVQTSIGSGIVVGLDGTDRVTNPVSIDFLVGSTNGHSWCSKWNEKICESGRVLISDDAKIRVNLDLDLSLDMNLLGQINMNQVYNFTLDEIQYLMCGLTSIQGLGADEFFMSTRNFSYYFEFDKYTDEQAKIYYDLNDSRQSKMFRALYRLRLALQASGWASASDILTSEVKYIMKRVAVYMSLSLNDSIEASTFNPFTCVNDTFQLSFANLINALTSSVCITCGDVVDIRTWPTTQDIDDNMDEGLGIFIPPWEKTISAYVQAQERQALIDGTWSFAAFNVPNNPFVTQLRSLGSIQPGDDLAVVANTSFFSQFLEPRPENSRSFDLVVNFTAFPILPPLANNDIIENLVITPRLLRVEKIENIDIQTFLPYGDENDFNRQASYTTKNHFNFNGLFNASIEVEVQTIGEFVGIDDGNHSEVFQINFEIEDLATELIVMAVVNVTEVERFQFDTFIEVDAQQNFAMRQDFFQCLMQGLIVANDENQTAGFALPGFQSHFTSLNKVELKSLGSDSSSSGQSLFASKEGIDVLSVAIDAFVSAYKSDAAVITQNIVRETAESYAVQTLRDGKVAGSCPDAVPPPLTAENEIFNFPQSTQMVDMYDFVENSMLNKDGSNPTININDVLQSFIDIALNGTQLAFEDIPLSFNGNSYGSLSLVARNVKITGLDAVDEIHLLDYRNVSCDFADCNDPTSDAKYITKTGIMIATSDDDDVTFTFDLDMNVLGLFLDRGGMKIVDGQTSVSNSIRIKFGLSLVNLSFVSMSQMNIPRFLKSPMENLLTLARLTCFLEVFETDGLRILDFDSIFGDMTLAMTCPGICESKDLQGLSGIDIDGPDAEVPAINQLLTDQLGTVVSLVKSYILSDTAAATLSAAIVNAAQNCNSGPAAYVPPVTVNAAFYFLIAVLCIFGPLFLVFALLIPFHMRRRNNVLKEALIEEIKQGYSDGKFLQNEERKVLAFGRHPAVPLIWRLLIPFLVISSVALFATANFASPGATVVLILSLFGDTTQPVEILEFTLEGSINDMWNSGAYPLAIIIGVLSGGWPYLKLILLAFCWFVPPTLVGVSWRRRIMAIIDQLGKWSLIDMYVLVILLVAFRFYISVSDVGALSAYFPADLIVVDVKVIPHWGMYGFLLGAIFSLVVNHMMLFWSEKVVRSDGEAEDKLAGTYVAEMPTSRISIFHYRFSTPDSEGRIYGFGPIAKILIGFLIVFPVLIVIPGSILPFIIFSFKGIGGIVLGLINADLTTVQHSVMSMAVSIIGVADPNVKSQIGLIFLQICYLLFAIVVPLCLCVLLGVLWFAPLNLGEQRSMLFAVDILAAWDSLFVLVASLLGATLQISVLVRFIVESLTGQLCVTLQNTLLSLGVSDIDAVCLDVTAASAETAALMVAGTVLMIVNWLLCRTIMLAVVEDRRLSNIEKSSRCPADVEPGWWRIGDKLLRWLTTPVARLRINPHKKEMEVGVSPETYDDEEVIDDDEISSRESERSTPEPTL